MNTRLAAIITLHNESTFSSEVNAYLDAKDGRSRTERLLELVLDHTYKLSDVVEKFDLAGLEPYLQAHSDRNNQVQVAN